MKSRPGAAAFALVATLLWTGIALGDGSGDPTAVKDEDGKYLDKQGNPTYSIKPDGTVDWYTYSGYVRYHSECHVCHGPNGDGSSYAPALKDSLKTLSYGDFLGVVAGGRKNVNTANENVMPAFGDNKNVMCVHRRHLCLSARARQRCARSGAARQSTKTSPKPPGSGRTLLRPGWMNGEGAMTKCGRTSLVGVRGRLLRADRDFRAGYVARARTRYGWREASNSSIRMYCGSAPIRTICRSPTKRAKVSKTSSPSFSRRNSARRSPTPSIPQATGFVRMTLGSHRCDVIMGYPQGDEMVQGTNPYYQTAYALGVQGRKSARWGGRARRPAPEGQAHRHRRRYAASHLSRERRA